MTVRLAEEVGGEEAVSMRVRLSSCFGEDRYFWPMAAVLLGTVSAAKGFRLPSTWGATQALINYQSGLVKRGLFGATLGRWLHLEHYFRFTVVSFGLLALLLGMLAWLTVRNRAFRRLGAGEPVVVFAASFAVTYLFHVVGYMEIVLAILAVGLVGIRGVKLRFAVAVPVCVAGLLLHEMFLFAFVPVVLFSFMLDGLMSQTRGRQTVIAAFGAALLCLCGAVTIRLALRPQMSFDQVRATTAEASARADFYVRPDVFSIQTRSARENIKELRERYRSVDYLETEVVPSALAFMPAFVVLLVGVGIAVRGLFTGRLRWAAMAAAMAAALSPMLLYGVGWDWSRWNMLLCLDAFVVLLVLSQHLPEAGVNMGRGYRNAAILAIALSMATGETLMDAVPLNTFPFTKLIQTQVRMLRMHQWGVPWK